MNAAMIVMYMIVHFSMDIYFTIYTVNAATIKDFSMDVRLSF